MKITRQHIEDQIVRENQVHQFSAFASDLGIRCDQIPYAFETELGNGQLLMLHHNGGEMLIYKQQLGCVTFTLFND